MTKGGKPKHPVSSYAFFVKTCREEHRKRYPDETVSFLEFSKKCAEKWKTMNEKERKRFEDMASTDKMRFQNDMREYVPADGEPDKKAIKRKKPVKDPNAPKRPLSSFFIFCADERPKVKMVYPDWSIAQIGKEMGRRWEQVTDRSGYVARADADKKRWEREMEIYKLSQGEVPKQPRRVEAPPAAAATHQHLNSIGGGGGVHPHLPPHIAAAAPPPAHGVLPGGAPLANTFSHQVAPPQHHAAAALYSNGALMPGTGSSSSASVGGSTTVGGPESDDEDEATSDAEDGDE